MNTKFPSLYSPSAKYAIHSSYLTGRIHNDDPLKDYFIYYSRTNPIRPLIVHAKLIQHMTLFYTYAIINHHIH